MPRVIVVLAPNAKGICLMCRSRAATCLPEEVTFESKGQKTALTTRGPGEPGDPPDSVAFKCIHLSAWLFGSETIIGM